jgi:hypothetical protein
MTSITNTLDRSNLLQIDPGKLLLRKLSGTELQEFQDRLDKLPDAHGAMLAAQSADGSADSLMKATQARCEFLTQQLAQEGSTDRSPASGSSESDSPAVTAFLDYMAKSPEERYMDAFLKSKGMTQEEFDALPPEQQQALIQEFKEYMKQSVERDSAEKAAEAARSELL